LKGVPGNIMKRVVTETNWKRNNVSTD
jgi:hypothetical protein